MTSKATNIKTPTSKNDSAVSLSENIKSKNILELDHTQARNFLLKGKSYCNFDLPKYFRFDNLIQEISKKIDEKNLSDFYLPIDGQKDSTKIAK